MSKHPGNPWWDQDHDVPIMILTRSDWDRAAAADHVTPEHVILRLRNAAAFAFGEEMSGIAFDADGFVVALTSAGLRLEGGVTLRVYPNDHLPPHVHVESKSYPRTAMRIDLTTAEFLGGEPPGIPAKKLRGFQSIVREHHAKLATLWQDYHGDPVELT